MATGRSIRVHAARIAALAICGSIMIASATMLIRSFSLPISELHRWHNDRAESGRVMLWKGRICFTGFVVPEDLSEHDIEFLKQMRGFDGLMSGVEGDAGVLGFYWHESPQVWSVRHWTPSGYQTDPRPHRMYRRLDIPLWLPLALSSGGVAWFLRRQWLSNRAGRLGLCFTCRYDLRGNVSGRCPECGTRIPPDVSKS